MQEWHVLTASKAMTGKESVREHTGFMVKILVQPGSDQYKSSSASAWLIYSEEFSQTLALR